MRLRASNFIGKLVSISITTKDFLHRTHQHKLDVATDVTNYIYNVTKKLFNELWDGKTPIRKLGVRVSELSYNDFIQISLHDNLFFDKFKKIDKSIDHLRTKYGKNTIQRACFLHSGISPITGGIGEDDYPVMTSIL